MEPATKKRLSLVEYNRLEEENDTRYEYHQGEVFAMVGAATDVGDPKHSAIAGSVIYLLTGALLSKSCTVFTSDAKYYIEAIDRSLYPDVSVVCGPPQRSDKDTRAMTNPILLVEVLSGSNANYDRGTKFHYYSNLPTFREYVLIEQDVWKVETRYRTSADQSWQMDWFEGENTEIVLRSIDVQLSMKDLYRGAEAL